MSVISHVRSRMTSFLCFVLFCSVLVVPWWAAASAWGRDVVCTTIWVSRYSFDHLVYLILADNDPDARYSFLKRRQTDVIRPADEWECSAPVVNDPAGKFKNLCMAERGKRSFSPLYFLSFFVKEKRIRAGHYTPPLGQEPPVFCSTPLSPVEFYFHSV